MTNQRLVIMGELRNTNSHPTTEYLHNRVKEKLPNIGLLAVRRSLEKLSEMGVIQKYEFSGRSKHYDWDIEPHDHIYCVECQRIDNIELERDQKPTLPTEHNSGYQIAGCRIFGVRPKCQKKMRA